MVWHTIIAGTGSIICDGVRLPLYTWAALCLLSTRHLSFFEFTLFLRTYRFKTNALLIYVLTILNTENPNYALFQTDLWFQNILKRKTKVDILPRLGSACQQNCKGSVLQMSCCLAPGLRLFLQWACFNCPTWMCRQSCNHKLSQHNITSWEREYFKRFQDNDYVSLFLSTTVWRLQGILLN